ncbi:histidine phosphatase family protein [Paenibacillus tarimensis]
MTFIRHAQGEHTVSPPDSLQTIDPALTDYGFWQAARLTDQVKAGPADLLVVSPMRRTLQTASLWSSNARCAKYVHPAVGPRMFPVLDESRAFKCDTPLPVETIQRDFPEFQILTDTGITWHKGINAIPDEAFESIADSFIAWCKSFNKQRVFIVSHDGTITSYRRYLGEIGVTRNDFLGETGWYTLNISCREN